MEWVWMRKFLLFLALFMFCIGANVACAEHLLSGAEKVTYVADKESKDKTVVRKYRFSLDESSRVNLHFVTHVNRYVSIKLMESETENPITALSGRISIDDNPINRSVDLKAGNYTFIVYKERPGGNVDNTGDYKFVFTKENIVAEVERPREENKKQLTMPSENVANPVPDRGKSDEERSSIEEIGDAIGIISGLSSILTGKHPLVLIIGVVFMYLIKPFL